MSSGSSDGSPETKCLWQIRCHFFGNHWRREIARIHAARLRLEAGIRNILTSDVRRELQPTMQQISGMLSYYIISKTKTIVTTSTKRHLPTLFVYFSDWHHSIEKNNIFKLWLTPSDGKSKCACPMNIWIISQIALFSVTRWPRDDVMYDVRCHDNCGYFSLSSISVLDFCEKFREFIWIKFRYGACEIISTLSEAQLVCRCLLFAQIVAVCW